MRFRLYIVRTTYISSELTPTQYDGYNILQLY
jgi:hypothetical protein